MQDTNKPVVVIAGPTASGKSAAALAVAETFGGVVINADSMQVYRDLHILTARPGPADEARVPHRLYGALDAAERCSAGRWLGLAKAAIEEARNDGQMSVVVGGTGLYLGALLNGLAPIPAVAPDIEAEGRALFAKLGGAAFRKRLAERDPDSAERIAESDPQRLIRAWAVAKATGRPLTQWIADHKPEPAVPGPIGGFALIPPRDVLYAAIDARFERMMEAGALEEVKALAARGLDPHLPAMKALGVAELLAVLRGEISRETALFQAQRKSRRYAKRQITWLRTQIPGLQHWNEQYSESLNERIFPFIRQFLLTAPN